MEFASKYNCIVVLKGAYTSVATPDGKVYFNSTGNPGMATAGSGDVLTGMILSLLAQGYSPENASVTVFIFMDWPVMQLRQNRVMNLLLRLT